MTQCFFLDPTERVQLFLRRYRTGEQGDCAGPFSYHNASVPIGEAPILWTDSPLDPPRRTYQAPPLADYKDDPRWPTHCICGEAFREDDRWQVFVDRIYVRRDTGAELILKDAPPGAMWDADWYPWKGPDGLSLVVVCPNGRQWSIDGRAKNCTDPNDSEHRCWLRAGEPPNITVSKEVPGQRTCSAGGGSIQAGDYHGFLQGGRFT